MRRRIIITGLILIAAAVWGLLIYGAVYPYERRNVALKRINMNADHAIILPVSIIFQTL